MKYNTKEFIKKASKIHNNKYDYSIVNYINNNTKIKIICPKHGEFLQTPRSHLSGADCFKCGHEKRIKKIKYTKQEWINKANKIHNFKYNYSKSKYRRIEDKGIIICPIHKEFIQTMESHLHGRGCPKCHSSKAENKIIKWLSDKKIHYIFQKKFKDCLNPKTNFQLKYDFYIPSKNLLIEYDGYQHFNVMTEGKFLVSRKRLNDTKFRDKFKTEYAKNNNIDLLRITYKEFNKIEQILTKTLL